MGISCSVISISFWDHYKPKNPPCQSKGKTYSFALKKQFHEKHLIFIFFHVILFSLEIYSAALLCGGSFFKRFLKG